jgi:hypothetical protein
MLTTAGKTGKRGEQLAAGHLAKLFTTKAAKVHEGNTCD